MPQYQRFALAELDIEEAASERKVQNKLLPKTKMTENEESVTREIFRLLDHESPDSETAVEKQLREELNAANADLDATIRKVNSTMYQTLKPNWMNTNTSDLTP